MAVRTMPPSDGDQTMSKAKTPGGPDNQQPAPPSLETQLREHYGSLPESERKIADLILDFPGELAAYSATEIAGLANASKAAVTRLIRRLGYNNFEEARRTVRDGRKTGSPIYLMGREAEPGSFATRIRDQIEQDVASISLTLEALYKETFDDVVKAIVGARRIWLAGFRNSHYLAGYLRWQFIQVRGDVHMLQGSGETLAETLADLQADDVLVVIGIRRRVGEVRKILDAARKAGTRTLFITDPTARDTLRATWTIKCEIRGNDFFDRYTGAMSFLHLLAVSVARAAGAKGRQRLKLIESLHEDLDAFK